MTVLRKRLIPSLLLRNGRLVKGRYFRDYRDAGAPETTARAHNAQGADEILILDIDASREGRRPDFPALRRVAAECFMPVTFGGGIRSREDALRALDAGADKVSLTTAALDRPGLVEDLAYMLGSQAIVGGVDVLAGGAGPLVYDFRRDAPVDGRSVVQWIDELVARGAGEIRITCADREGSRAGMDLGLIGCLATRLKVPLVVEGGAGVLDHLAEALNAGASGVGVGTMLVFSDNNLVKIKRFLRSQNCSMRL
ncbi:MAG TPA: imidazole glycerol phosphate synthase cyclase subunit [Burkholderiales bacterium]|nr:imidazole glycerol phosphate synthase cyclase subunit [Burkholderiales bacterium]